MAAEYAKDFGPFKNGIWLNTASEGALPQAAVKALLECIEWKVQPYLLTHRRFNETPLRLKKAIGQLFNVSPADVILGNSATYGIHLLANGIPFKSGDEVLTMRNDFPTDILPWLGLEKRGVLVRQLPSEGPVIQAEELFNSVTSATRLICLPHVHTFSGHILDVATIGKFCRDRGILFFLNISQSAGCMPLDIARLPVDAVTTAGFKWLCGPYGTGFCWMKPSLRQSLDYNQSYWINVLSAEELNGVDQLNPVLAQDAARYDVFGTANFFNFIPWISSIEYLLSVGVEKIFHDNSALGEKLISGLDPARYDLISPSAPEKRSGLIVFSHKDRSKNRSIFDLLISQKIYLALWKGNLRASPHFYNTPQEIEKLFNILNQQ